MCSPWAALLKKGIGCERGFVRHGRQAHIRFRGASSGSIGLRDPVIREEVWRVDHVWSGIGRGVRMGGKPDDRSCRFLWSAGGFSQSDRIDRIAHRRAQCVCHGKARFDQKGADPILAMLKVYKVWDVIERSLGGYVK